MRVLGVIHARGGSKRIPRKNVKKLNGQPLIAYSIRAAQESGLDRLIVSTDDEEIGQIAKSLGAEFPFIRPAELSEDVPSEWVTLHALRWIKAHNGESFDVVLTLQPTTPFVKKEDIRACIEQLEQDAELASCFTARPIREPPQWMFIKNENKRFSPFLPGPISGERGIFQSLPELCLPNGAVYATRVTHLENQGRLFAEPTSAVIMPLERSVELDEPIDWHMAEILSQQV